MVELVSSGCRPAFLKRPAPVPPRRCKLADARVTEARPTEAERCRRQALGRQVPASRVDCTRRPKHCRGHQQ